MTDRDRLIELIFEVSKERDCTIENTADYLLANGVIVPPCKVGDTVYFIIDDEISGKAYIDSQRINDVSTRGIFVSTSTLEENCDSFEPYSDFGKTVFLTKEEAEAKLRERSGEDADL